MPFAGYLPLTEKNKKVFSVNLLLHKHQQNIALKHTTSKQYKRLQIFHLPDNAHIFVCVNNKKTLC